MDAYKGKNKGEERIGYNHWKSVSIISIQQNKSSIADKQAAQLDWLQRILAMFQEKV